MSKIAKTLKEDFEQAKRPKLETHEDRLKYFAAGNVTTECITQVFDHELKSRWVGKVRGIIIGTKEGGPKFFEQESEARDYALNFRLKCREDLTKLYQTNQP